MVKKLRSLILEEFPEDLRVDIELLSRKRSIHNAEKQEELLKLLRKYNIEGIVPLGSGTNRYAFKLKGFVVKVATDNDGKIDNLKEFKMAPILYPDVTKIYDVSSNGTLLVAEYIEPFSSYAEMIDCQSEIKEILKKWNSAFLIGDVGISKNNYANWGKRIGSDSPVCLDFAYAYNVTSKLFICHNCKAHSMLIPNEDYTQLICPTCNKAYRFEEIRARLGNDIHNHEIGDLTQEGYQLSESGKEVTLDPKRSKYLRVKIEEKKKKDDKKPEPSVEEEIPDTFVVDDNKEERQMSYKKFGNTYIVTATAESVNNEIEDDEVVVKATPVAFSSDVADDSEIDDIISSATAETVEQIPDDDPEPATDVDDVINQLTSEPAATEEPEQDGEPVEDNFVVPDEPEEVDDDPAPDVIKEVIPEPEKVEHPAEIKHESAEKHEGPAPKVIGHINIPVEHHDTTPVDDNDVFSSDFIKDAYRYPFEVAKKISSYISAKSTFENIGGDVYRYDGKAVTYPKEFYSGIQHAVDHAILEFCNFEVKEGVNRAGKPCKNFFAPEQLTNAPYTGTMIFLARFAGDEEVNSAPAADVMRIYRIKYSNNDGLQPEIRDTLIEKIKNEFATSDSTRDKIVNLIAAEWFSHNVSKKEEPDDDPEPEIAEVTDEPAEETTDTIPQEVVDKLESSATQDTPEENQPGVAFSGDVAEDASDINQISKDDQESDEDDDNYKYTSIDVYLAEADGEPDAIVYTTPGAYGLNTITLYEDFEKLDNKKLQPSMVDDRNGVWDWLIHGEPVGIIRTDNPDKFVKLNDEDISDDWGTEQVSLKFAILDETEQGDWLVGMYPIGNIDIVDADGNYQSIMNDKDLMIKINNLIVNNVGITKISALSKTINVDSKINTISEHEFDSWVQDIESDEEDDSRPDDKPDELEDAAVAALLGSNAETEDRTEDDNSKVVSFKPIYRTQPKQ